MKTPTLIAFLLTASTCLAQPHISGEVTIDQTNGLFQCRFTLTNTGDLPDSRILLNKGMVIKYFKDSSGNLIDYNGHYAGKMEGEALSYALVNGAYDTIPVPDTLFLEYTGAFPVYAEEDWKAFDYKGIIAINHETVRASEQTKWYPVLYDATGDRMINSYTYDVTITLKGGETIFLNGSAPQKGPTARFRSQRAYPLLLFAGNYPYVENGGDYILNVDLKPETAGKIFANIELIKGVLATNLELSFTDHIYLISHKPLNQRREGSSWGFNTFPSFAFTGLDFETLVDEEGKFSNNMYRYFGHEFGHNYFGNNVLSGKWSWFWLESFAEYLSYNVVEDLIGPEYLAEVLVDRANQIEERTFSPLPAIQQREEIDPAYRYTMAPLMLKCYEDTFGRKAVNNTIKNLLVMAESATLTLDHWKRAATQSGITAKAFDEFAGRFIEPADFNRAVIEQIKATYGK